MRVRHTIAFAAAALFGVLAGLGTYTFAYARGWASLTNDARACANCHVMTEQYDVWAKSSARVFGEAIDLLRQGQLSLRPLRTAAKAKGAG